MDNDNQVKLDLGKFKEDLKATTSYADELYKKPKIRVADLSDEAKQQQTFETFAKAAFMYHTGIAENNRAITAHISFGEFINEYLGFRQNEKFGFSLDLLKACGFHENSSLAEIGEGHQKFSSASTVVNQGYRWIIPQILQNVAYQNSVISPPKHTNWVSGTTNVGDAIEVLKPIVLANDAVPYVSNEFQSITYATATFAQKLLKFTKLEKGFKLGRKQTRLTTIPMLPLLTKAVTDGFAKAMDTLVVLALLNGDQADLSEAAKTTGVRVANTPEFRDFLRVKTRSTRMNLKYDTMLTSEETALNIAMLPEFLGMHTGTGYKLADIGLKKEFYPSINELDVSGAYPKDKSVLNFDSTQALEILIQRPLNFESEFSLSKEETVFYARKEFAIMSKDLLARLKMLTDSADESFHAIFEADVLEKADVMTW